MTEKRFDVVYEEDDEYKNIRYWEIKDKKCGATTSNELKICHLLNNLNDENEQLKDALKQRTEQCDKYYDENEQLKSELSETREILQSVEQDRRQCLLVCKKYEGFFKEKGYDIHDLIDYARDGSND